MFHSDLVFNWMVIIMREGILNSGQTASSISNQLDLEVRFSPRFVLTGPELIQPWPGGNS